MTDANLIEIFCILDEFCKYLAPELKKHTRFSLKINYFVVSDKMFMVIYTLSFADAVCVHR